MDDKKNDRMEINKDQWGALPDVGDFLGFVPMLIYAIISSAIIFPGTIYLGGYLLRGSDAEPSVLIMGCYFVTILIGLLLLMAYDLFKKRSAHNKIKHAITFLGVSLILLIVLGISIPNFS
jgi:hypothetical protein